MIWIKPHVHLRCSTTRSIAGRDQAKSFPLREAADPRTVPVHHQAIVVLDFVNPNWASRRSRHFDGRHGSMKPEGTPPLDHVAEDSAASGRFNPRESAFALTLTLRQCGMPS